LVQHGLVLDTTQPVASVAVLTQPNQWYQSSGNYGDRVDASTISYVWDVFFLLAILACLIGVAQMYRPGTAAYSKIPGLDMAVPEDL
jgi:hypothetical protein